MRFLINSPSSSLSLHFLGLSSPFHCLSPALPLLSLALPPPSLALSPPFPGPSMPSGAGLDRPARSHKARSTGWTALKR